MKYKTYTFLPKPSMSKTYFQKFLARVENKDVVEVVVRYDPDTGSIDRVDVHYMEGIVSKTLD